MDAATLHARLRSADAPLVLDVRNDEEFARWKVDGPEPVETFHLPYFDFIEDEDGASAKVRAWLAGRDREVVVVCAKGGSSDYVAEVLRPRGVRAENLDGGMLAWGIATAAREIPAGRLRAWQLDRFGKGCLSYVLAAGEDAVVVDPHRDADRYLAFLDERKLKLRAVVDTHLHADHVSGARALAERTGATYHANAADFEGAPYEIAPLRDGERLLVGGVELTPVLFLHAPGHTPGSSMLRVGDDLLLTGDTLFIGSVGRPDLAGKTAEWSHDLWDTLHRRLVPVPDGAHVLPAHSAGPREARSDGTVAARLGELRRRNGALALDEAAFLRRVTETPPAAPPQYDEIRRINLTGAADDAAALEELELGKNECAMGPRRP